MPTAKPRFTITMDDELLNNVEKYRFANEFKSQTQAVLSLIEKGFDALRDTPQPTALAYGGGGEYINPTVTRNMRAEKSEQDEAYREAKLALLDKIRLAEIDIKQIEFLTRLIDIL